MNPYLAFCHALSLLEQPISARAFSAAVITARNPLFTSPCSQPRHFLWVLQHEGVLHLQQGRFQLQGAGMLLYSQVLNWSARDKAALLARKQHSSPPPLQRNCARCGTGFCGLHLMLALLQRVYSGMADWQQWSAAEIALLQTVLITERPAAVLDHSQLLHPEDAPPDLPEGWPADALAACLRRSQTRRCLPAVAGIDQLSRLHLDYGLIAEHPQPVLRVSQMGFSDDGQRAVLWYAEAGALTGGRHWHLWEKHPQDWHRRTSI